MKDWVLKFPFYVSEHSITDGYINYSVKFKLDPLAYWLIRYFHGASKLIEMSARIYLENGGTGRNEEET